MRSTNTEIQRKFKKKMYKAGLKQTILWIKRKESRPVARMTQSEFLKNLKKLTKGWDDDSLTQLYCLLIKITKGNKEAARLKRK